MAAFSCAARVLRSRLDDTSVPLEQRLKFCKKAVRCKRLSPLLNNTLVIPEWVMDKLNGIKSDDISSYTSHKLWKVLLDFLRSSQKDNLNLSHVKLSPMFFHLGPGMVQLLTNGLKCCKPSLNMRLQLTIIDSCSIAIKHCILQKYFAQGYEEFAHLLVAVINGILSHGKNSCCHNKLRQILSILSELISTAQRNQSNHEEVFIITCKMLLEPFSQLASCNTLHMCEPTTLNLLKNAIWNALFNRELEQSYQHMLSYFFDNSFSNECPQVHKAFLDSLEKMLVLNVDAYDAHDPVVYLFVFLLEGYVTRFKKFEHFQKFNFFILLVELLGIDICPKETLYFKNNFKAGDRCELMLSRLAKMLTAVKQQLSLNFEDDVTTDSEISTKPSVWFQILAEYLLRSCKVQCTAWYQCWQALLEINSSIVTGRISMICVVAWLSPRKVDVSAKTSQSVFLCQLVQLYSKLHQLPKLVSKILAVLTVDSDCNYLEEPHFPPDVLQKFGEMCTELHPAQSLELWHILNNYILNYISRISSLNGEEHSLKVFSSIVYPAVECLNSLLSNIRLVDINLPKDRFDVLINMSVNTSNSCVPHLILQSFKMWDSILLQNALLLAYYWGDLHMNLLNYNSKYSEHWHSQGHHNIPISVDVNDLSVLHYYLGSHEWDLIFKACIKNGDKTLLYIMMQLILQKMRALILFGGKNIAAEIQGLQNTANCIASVAKYSDPSNTWNGKISGIDEESYDTATWFLICRNLEKIVPYLSPHQMGHISNIIVSTFDSKIEQKESMLNIINQSICTTNLIRSPTCHEFGVLQSSIMVSLSEKLFEIFLSYLSKKSKKRGNVSLEMILNMLRCFTEGHDKWLFMANSKPFHASGQMNPLWIAVDNASKILHEIFSLAITEHAVFSGKHFPVNVIFEQLKFLSQLSLEYFLPGNQMLCMFEVFAGIVPLVNCTNICSAQIQGITLGFKIGIYLIDGLRSMWIFDFVQPKNLLLWIYQPCMKLLASLGTDSINHEAIAEFRHAQLQFLEALVLLIIRNKSALTDFNDFLTEVELVPSTEVISDLDASSYSVAFLTALMKSFNKARQQKTVSGKFLDTCNNNLSLISKHVISWFNMLIDSGHFDALYSSKDFTVINVLEGFIAILDFGVVVDEEIDPLHCENLKQWHKLIPSITNLVSHVSKFLESPACLQSSCQFLSTIIKYREKFPEYLSEDCFKQVWKSLKLIFIKIDSLQKRAHTDCTIDKYSSESFFTEQIIVLSSETEFSWLLEDLFGEMNVCTSPSLNIQRLKGLLYLWKIITSGPLNADKETILISNSNKLLIFFQYLLHQIGVKPQYTAICVLIMEVEAALIKNTQLTSERLALCLHCSSFLDFSLVEEPIAFEKYLSSFFLLLNNILISQHAKTISKLVPSLVTAVQAIMHVVINRGQQNLLKDGSEEALVLIGGCAQNVERLMTQMALHKLDFAKVAPYLISDFVTTASSVTLHPIIKNHLTNGIYAILDICEEKAVAALSTLLTPSGRQIFNSLYASYKLYYVYKGKV